MGVGSTLPCAMVTSNAALALSEKNKIIRIFLIIRIFKADYSTLILDFY